MAMEVCPATVPEESTMVDGTAPPELVGVAVGDIATSLINSNQSGLYEIEGATSLMVMVTVVEDEPPELLAQIV